MVMNELNQVLLYTPGQRLPFRRNLLPGPRSWPGHVHGVYEKCKRTREFQDHWLDIYNYLRYDKKANVMYCIN